jgi:nitrogen fixation protein FixH
MNPSIRNPWPIAIIAYFVVFISFIVGFVAFASRQKVDLVSANYYEDEVRFQQHLDRVERARSVPAKVAYEPNRNAITIHLPIEHVLRLSSGSIRLYRPSNEKLDREIPLRLDNYGVQEIDARVLAPGLWKVRLNWKWGDQEYSCEQAIIAAPPRS